jgi:predicted permease
MTHEARLLIGVSSVLLLIVCANVAGLLLVRSDARRKEIAIRLSMGAGRFRVMRQLLTEGVVMVVLGGGAGVIASLWLKAQLAAFYVFDSEGYSHRYDFSMNPRVVMVSAGVCLVTALLFGLAPALAVTRQDFASALKNEGNSSTGRRGGRLRNSLVATQAALSLMLVVATFLLVRSAGNIAHGGNFYPKHVALLRLRPRLLSYTPDQAQAYLREVLQRLRAMPEVESAAYARGVGSVWGGGNEANITLPGQSNLPNQGLTVNYLQISPRYFDTLKLPLLQGREFDETDNLKSPRVAIVNQTLAQRLESRAPVLGQIVVVNGEPCRVVGVAADKGFSSASMPAEPLVYTAFWQDPSQVDVRMAIRVKSDEGSALPLLHKTISRANPAVPITEEMPMITQVQGQYSSVLIARAVAVSAGSLALCLSMVGLYALLAYSVRRRTREIGIRMALGAARRDVAAMILREALLLAAAGVALGLVLSFVAGRFLAALLFGVQPVDLTAFAAGTTLLFSTLLTAGFFPAQRATRVDPVIALRCE